MEGSNGARPLVRALKGCATLVACALAASCGSGNGSAGEGSGPLTATFSSIQTNVFTPICATCHAGASAPHGLRLDGNNSYALLVGVPSDEEPSILRVKPNDPDNSYLVQKIQGTAASGERMPAGMPALPQATIDTIRQWITNGATNDTLTSSAAIRVSSLSPLPGSSMTTLPAAITVTFDREVNATTVDATTFKLVRSGGDGVFGNGNDVAITPASVTVPAANTHSAVMSLAGVASASDTYQITLSGSGAVKILDLSGNALDGEYSGTLPSGNGTAGGDFVATFTVGTVQATLQSIQDNVFTPICSRCHIGASAPEGLQLDAAHSYSLLVGVPSEEQPNLLRVKAGDPDNSYMIRKIQGGPGISGGQMPLGGPPLPQATINIMRQWVTEGAQNATATAMAAVKHAQEHAFELTATSPADQADVSAPLGTLVAAFSNEVDASLVNDTTVRLERIQPDSELLTPLSPALPIHLSLASGNPAAILVQPVSPLPPGRYRLTLRGTGGGALGDVSGAVLGTDEYIVFTVHAAQTEPGAAQ